MFLNKGLRALSARHLFFGVISIFRTPLSSLFVPHASGHRCLLLSSYFSRRDQPRPGGSSPRSERRVSFFHPQSRRKTFRARPLQTDKLEGRGVRRMRTLFHVNCKERNHRPSASVHFQTNKKTNTHTLRFLTAQDTIPAYDLIKNSSTELRNLHSSTTSIA